MLYCHPKLERTGCMDDPEAVGRGLEDIRAMEVRELPGGVYFKIVCVVMQLVELNPERDYSGFLEFVLQKVVQSRRDSSKKAMDRALSDFSQMSK